MTQTPAAPYSLNKREGLAVAQDQYLQPISTCPHNVKVQLLGRGGVLVYGTYDGKNDFWVSWAPLPRKAPV